MHADLLIFEAHAIGRYGYADRLRPLDGKRLAVRETGPLTRHDLERHLRQGRNLGMRLYDGLMVVDKDGENLGPYAGLSSPFTVLTSRGTHEYFRTELDATNKIKATLGGVRYDVDLLFHGVTVLPPSLHPTTDWRYRLKSGLVREEDLPLFPVELLPTEVPRAAPVIPLLPVTDAIERVRRYLATIVAVSGQGGDRTTYRAACRAAEATGGDEEKTLALLVEWNETNCQPKWDVGALRHKARCAIRAVFG